MMLNKYPRSRSRRLHITNPWTQLCFITFAFEFIYKVQVEVHSFLLIPKTSVRIIENHPNFQIASTISTSKYETASSSKFTTCWAFWSRDRIWETNDINFVFRQSTQRTDSQRQPFPLTFPWNENRKNNERTINGKRSDVANSSPSNLPPDQDPDDESETELKYLLNRFQNRATIMESTLQSKMEELLKMTRRVEILQDVVKEIHARETYLIANVTELTLELSQKSDAINLLKEENDRMELDFENHCSILDKKVNETQQKYMEVMKQCDTLKADLESKEQIISEKDVLLEETTKKMLNNGTKSSKSEKKRYDHENEREMLKLNERIINLSQQLETLQTMLKNEETELETQTKSIATISEDDTESNSEELEWKLEIAQAAVQASQECESKLQNRIEIIQNELQLVLTEKDNLEQAQEETMQSNLQLQQQLEILQDRYDSMEIRYQRQLATSQTKLDQSHEERKFLEMEREKYMKKLVFERQRSLSERQQDQAHFEKLLQNERDYHAQARKTHDEIKGQLREAPIEKLKEINDHDNYLSSLTNTNNTNKEMNSNKARAKGSRLKRILRKATSPRTWFRAKTKL